MDGSPQMPSASEAPESDGPRSPRRFAWARRALGPVAGVVLIALVGRHLFTGLEEIPFHVDEDIHLGCTYNYYLVLHEGRWDSWYYHRQLWQSVAVGNSYWLGLGLDLSGEPVERSPHKFETWWAANKSLPKKCHRFAPSTLLAGRRIQAVASLGACVALLLLTWLALGWPAALVATALLGWNPLLAECGRRAMAEGWLLFLWLATLLIPVAFFRVLTGAVGARRSWLRALQFVGFGLAQGVAIGLAVGTKYAAGLTVIATGLFLVSLVVGRLVVVALRHQGFRARARAWLADRLTVLLVLSVAVLAAAAPLTFVGMNPHLHADPTARTLSAMRFFTSLHPKTQKDFAEDALLTRRDAIRSTAHLTLAGDYVTFPRMWPAGVYAGFLLIGFVVLVLREIRCLRRGEPTARIPVLLWIAATTIGIVAWIPLEWPRWYLPLIPGVCVLVAQGLVSAVVLAGAAAREFVGKRYGPAVGEFVRKRFDRAAVGEFVSRLLGGAVEPRRTQPRLHRRPEFAALVVAFVSITAVVGCPAFGAWRLRARCRSNLRRIGRALQQYRLDHGEWPPWLSSLYPAYIEDQGVLVCPDDDTGGAEGGVPPWSPGQQFTETDDTGCSYVYEYCAAACSWWPSGRKHAYPDANGDGVVSWQEAKSLVEQRGLQPDGRFDAAKGYGDDVPIVRCFWHTSRHSWESEEAVLNVRVGDGSLYHSTGAGDGWQRATRLCRDVEKGTAE